MVDIPVERKKRGAPWWIWLLVALTILALGWFALAAAGGGDRTATGAAMDADETVTSLNQLTGNAALLAGQRVDLEDVQVVALPPGGGLLVAETGGTPVYVATPDAARFAIGNEIDVSGSVQASEAGGNGLASRPAGLPADATHYIAADRIEE